RGEVTYVHSSTAQLVMSDPQTIQRVVVRVDVEGDGDLVLVAPNGTAVSLGRASSATFGLDAVSVDSLDVFRGTSAAGTWTLQIRGAAVLRSWSLGIQFAGEQRLE